MKILIIRFSSIGDIVLTFPVITAIRNAYPESEIHFATKRAFETLLLGAKEINKVHFLDESFRLFKEQIANESFDYIIDLHHNLRTRRLTFGLKAQTARFHKLNVKKWLLTRFGVSRMPDMHIVDRYLNTLDKLGLNHDKKPQNTFHLPEDSIVSIKESFPELGQTFVALAIGAQFNTKKLPKEKWLELIGLISQPMIILGGNMDVELAEWLMQHSVNKTVLNACGKLSILQSASLVSQAQSIITHDTGLMHIAACFQTQIISIWGNTVPEFGMIPYRPNGSGKDKTFEVSRLKCRPCSKIGFQTCPKGHFDCMMKQNIQAISESLSKP